MKAYFLSDIHLYSMEDPKAGILLRFLKSIDRTTTHLFLMGDIFDIWFGNHEYFATQFAPLLHEIVNLRSRGVEIHFFEGNHDMHLEEIWTQKLGVEVHEEPKLMRLGHWKLRLEHGDETNPDDHVYRFQRWTLRTPFIELLTHNAPTRFVRFIAENWSQQSRKKRPYVNETVRQRSRQFAREKSLEQDFDLMICGHTHMRDDYEFESRGRKVRFINLGTWLVKPAVLEITDETIQYIELSS